uniref:tRNA-intron lyase n=1 Tax=Mesocestoides corti TaxID=53468 RepID=A0A5K3FHX6_MESCO
YKDRAKRVLTEEERLLGRTKICPERDVPRRPIYPLVYTCGGEPYVFTATLVDPRSQSKVATITSPDEIDIVQKMGCYGYVPGQEQLRSAAANVTGTDLKASLLYLFDTEIFFLLHGLGCLQVRIPRSFLQNEDGSETKSATRQLWNMLCSRSGDADQRSHGLPDFPSRYAAYFYYRSNGWIVRPSLALGGVDFLLYAEPPQLRHAAYAVLVVPASSTGRTVRDITAHFRVVSSVAKVARV